MTSQEFDTTARKMLTELGVHLAPEKACKIAMALRANTPMYRLYEPHAKHATYIASKNPIRSIKKLLIANKLELFIAYCQKHSTSVETSNDSFIKQGLGLTTTDIARLLDRMWVPTVQEIPIMQLREAQGFITIQIGERWFSWHREGIGVNRCWLTSTDHERIRTFLSSVDSNLALNYETLQREMSEYLTRAIKSLIWWMVDSPPWENARRGGEERQYLRGKLDELSNYPETCLRTAWPEELG